jgi:deoxyribodipyrimidine photolyase-related protein
VKRIIYVSHDQLNAKYGALKGSNPKVDLVVLVESARMLTEEFGSKVRLYFLLSSAANALLYLSSINSIIFCSNSIPTLGNYC